MAEEAGSHHGQEWKREGMDQRPSVLFKPGFYHPKPLSRPHPLKVLPSANSINLGICGPLGTLEFQMTACSTNITSCLPDFQRCKPDIFISLSNKGM